MCSLTPSPGVLAASDFLSLGIVWASPLPSSTLAPPAADAERVYLPLRNGRLVALAIADGSEQWAVDLAVTHALAVDGARVFAVTGREMVALDAASGRRRWRVPIGGATTAPATLAGWVLVGAGVEILAFRAADGHLVWRQPLGSGALSPAVIAGDRAYTVQSDGHVVALDITQGTIVWQTRLPAPAGGVTVAGDRLFVGGTDNFLYALDALDGDRRWRWRTGADVAMPAAHDGERVYFVALDNLLRALDADSGVQRWRHPMDTRPLSGPVLDDDLLIVSGGSELIAVRAANGTLAGKWTAPGELAAPALFRRPRVTGAARVIIVTGTASGGWQVYGLGRVPTAPLRPLTEIPGRPLPLAVPPVLP